jgi:hypothetical protein
MKITFGNGYVFETESPEQLSPIEELIGAMGFLIISTYNRELNTEIKKARFAVLVGEIVDFFEQKIEEYSTRKEA